MTSVRDEPMQVAVESAGIRVVTTSTQGPAGPTALAAGDVITDEGGLIIGGTGGTPEALPIGTANQVLTITAGRPDWTEPFALDSTKFATLQDALDEAGFLAGDGLRGAMVTVPRGIHEIEETMLVPQGVTVVGPGAQSTQIKASAASFPIDTPLVQMGDEREDNQHGMILRDLWLNCNDKAGSTGVYSRTAQESSMLDRVIISQFCKRGVYILGDFITYQPNHFEIRDTQVLPASSTVTEAMVEADGLGMALTLHRTSLVQDPAPAVKVPFGLRGKNCDVVFRNLHVESCTVGVQVELGTTGRGALFGQYLTGHPTVDTILKVIDTARTDVHFIREFGAPVTIDYSGVDPVRQWTGFVDHFSNSFDKDVVNSPLGGVYVGGAWDYPHPKLRSNGVDYHLWIDTSGRLRIKSSAPASDTDGTVVGSQT